MIWHRPGCTFLRDTGPQTDKQQPGLGLALSTKPFLFLPSSLQPVAIAQR